MQASKTIFITALTVLFWSTLCAHAESQAFVGGGIRDIAGGSQNPTALGTNQYIFMRQRSGDQYALPSIPPAGTPSVQLAAAADPTTDTVVSTSLTKAEQKNSAYALNALMKTATKKVNPLTKMMIRSQFTSFATMMRKHAGVTCSGSGHGMVCSSPDGAMERYPNLDPALAARSIAQKDNTVAMQKAGTTAAAAAATTANTTTYANYLAANQGAITLSNGQQTAFPTAPVAVLPSSPTPPTASSAPTAVPTSGAATVSVGLSAQ